MPEGLKKPTPLMGAVYYLLNSQFAELFMRGAEATASARRADCILLRTSIKWAGPLTGSDVRGAMVTISDTATDEFLRSQRYPIINLSNSSGIKEGMGNLLNDDLQIGRLAAAFLLKRGFRTFMVFSSPGAIVHQERTQGFCEALRTAGFPVICSNISLKFSIQFNSPEAYLEAMRDEVRQPLSEAPLGCGIFATNNTIAQVIQQVLHAFYPEHRDTTGVLGCDGKNDGRGYYGYLPSLSSINPAFVEMGATAMDWLLDNPGSAGKDIVHTLHKRFAPLGAIEGASTASGSCAEPLTARMIRWTWEQLHHGEKCSVSDIASAHHINRKTLERRFAEHAGTTPGDLIARMRLDRARELLRTTRLSVAEISETCGYAKQDVLSRALRRDSGCTPTEFRRQSASGTGG